MADFCLVPQVYNARRSVYRRRRLLPCHHRHPHLQLARTRDPRDHTGECRFNVDMAAYPTIARIDSALAALPEFQKAAPEVQPDAEVGK